MPHHAPFISQMVYPCVEDLEQGDLRELARLLVLRIPDDASLTEEQASAREKALAQRPPAEWLSEQKQRIDLSDKRKAPFVRSGGKLKAQALRKINELLMRAEKRSGGRLPTWARRDEFPLHATLCDAHARLDPWLVREVFHMVTEECVMRAAPLRSLESEKHPGSLRRVDEHLAFLNAASLLWADEAFVHKSFNGSRFGYRVQNHGCAFAKVESRCEACIVAVIGGTPMFLCELRAAITARLRKHDRRPKLLIMVDAWIDESMDPEMRSDSRVTARAIRRILKENMGGDAKRHEGSGRRRVRRQITDTRGATLQLLLEDMSQEHRDVDIDAGVPYAAPTPSALHVREYLAQDRPPVFSDDDSTVGYYAGRANVSAAEARAFLNPAFSDMAAVDRETARENREGMYVGPDELNDEQVEEAFEFEFDEYEDDELMAMMEEECRFSHVSAVPERLRPRAVSSREEEQTKEEGARESLWTDVSVHTRSTGSTATHATSTRRRHPRAGYERPTPMPSVPEASSRDSTVTLTPSPPLCRSRSRSRSTESTASTPSPSLRPKFSPLGVDGEEDLEDGDNDDDNDNDDDDDDEEDGDDDLPPMRFVERAEYTTSSVYSVDMESDSGAYSPTDVASRGG